MKRFVIRSDVIKENEGYLIQINFVNTNDFNYNTYIFGKDKWKLLEVYDEVKKDFIENNIIDFKKLELFKMEV